MPLAPELRAAAAPDGQDRASAALLMAVAHLVVPVVERAGRPARRTGQLIERDQDTSVADTAAGTLATAFRLHCGAFDFLVCDSEPVFLEVNPGGDWRWIEHKIGSSRVSEAAARMLRDLHQAQPLVAGTPREPFSLLSFLAG